jgi:hypothetical protein
LKTLERFYRQTIECLSHHVVPLDWKKSLEKEMVYQRITETWQDIMKDVVYENTKRKNRLTNGQIERVVVMLLGTANVKDDLLVQVMTRFEGNQHWKDFVQSIRLYSGDELRSKAVLEMHPTFKLYVALQCTCNVKWMYRVDYISPGCFMYLVERLLLLTSCSKGFMYATKSSFTEWLICQDENSLSNLSFMRKKLDIVHDFLANILHELVWDQNGTKTWIEKSKLDVQKYFPSFVLRLFVSICLLHLGSGSDKYIKLLLKLLGKKFITAQLPSKFLNVLKKGKKNMCLEVFAAAFNAIGNPLVIAKLQNNSSEIVCSDAVFVDLTICQKRELILETLFPSRVDSVGEEATTEALESTSKEFSSNLPNETSASLSDQSSNGQIKDEINRSLNVACLWNCLENFASATDVSCLNSVSPDSLMLKVSQFFYVRIKCAYIKQ